MLSSSMMALLIPQPQDLSASYINAFIQSLETIDAHNHTTGHGAPIPAAALGIDGTVPFNGNSAKGLRSMQLLAQSLALSASSDIQSLFVMGGDLYFFNGSSQVVRVTNGSQVNRFDVLGGPVQLGNSNSSVESGLTGNGYIYYDTTNNRVRVCVNGTWKTVTVT
jgi:hypothetical protein